MIKENLLIKREREREKINIEKEREWERERKREIKRRKMKIETGKVSRERENLGVERTQVKWEMY